MTHRESLVPLRRVVVVEDVARELAHRLGVRALHIGSTIENKAQVDQHMMSAIAQETRGLLHRQCATTHSRQQQGPEIRQQVPIKLE
jgi:hypothetical protein